MWSLASGWNFSSLTKQSKSHGCSVAPVCVCGCVSAPRCWRAPEAWAKLDRRQLVWWLGHCTKLCPQVCGTLRELRAGSKSLANIVWSVNNALLGALRPLTMYSMLEARGYTWPRSLLCRSRMSCASLSLMALFPLCLASHQSPSSSRYLSRIRSQPVEFGSITTEAAAWSSRSRAVALVQHPDACFLIVETGTISSSGRKNPGEVQQTELPLGKQANKIGLMHPTCWIILVSIELGKEGL